VPFSEARVFRTEKGFIIKDKEDDTWIKHVPFDDLDRIKTEVACKTLDPVRINAMKTMPLPVMTELPQDLIEEFETDFEQLCKESISPDQESDLIHLSSLWTDDSTDAPVKPTNHDQPENLTLTRQDVIQNQFGSLTPYLDDYINNTYEVEENHATHLPSLTQSYQVSVSNKYGPLSYQNSILEDDPIIEEDLEDPENNIYPSTLLPNLVRAHLHDRMGTPEQPRMGTPESPKIETPIPKEENLNQTDQDENELMNQPENIDEWAMLKNSIPPGFFYNSIITSFLLIIVFLGFIIQIPMAFLIGVFSFLYYFGPKTVQGLRDIFKTFMDNYFNAREQRKRFTNRTGHTDRAVRNPSKLYAKTKSTGTTSIRMNAMDGFHIIKPEGSVASSKKIKRTYQIEPAKVSEARIIKTVDNRHFFQVLFFEHISRLALYDPGACSCTISPKFLEELQAIGHVPTEETSLNVYGVTKKSSSKANKIAYLDFQLETGYWLKNVPFVVFDTGNDILIGNNLIRAHRWANCWKNSNFYIDIGNNEPLIPTYNSSIPHDKEIAAVSISDITIYPSETTTVGLTIPYMGSRSLSHFKHRDLLSEPLLEPQDDDLLEYFPTLSRLRKKELAIVVRNKGDLPFKIEKGMEVAKVSAVEKDQKPKKIEELHEAMKIYNSIPRIHTNDCHCKIADRLVEDRDKEETAIRIVISDQLGNTSIGNLLTPEEGGLLQPGIHLKKSSDKKNAATILLVTDEQGSLAHIDRIRIRRARQQLREHLKHKQVPLFFFMDPLHTIAFTSRLVINDVFKEFKFSFYPVRTTGHVECVRPALSMYVPELFVGVNKTKIHIQNGPVHPPKESLLKEYGTPLVKTSIQGAILFCLD
jgi:hypothetical protein